MSFAGEVFLSLRDSRGREVRVVVNPQRVDDQAAALGTDVTNRIEDECVYPGQIKVALIRDTQSSLSRVQGSSSSSKFAVTSVTLEPSVGIAR